MRHVLVAPMVSAPSPPVGGRIHDWFGQTMGTVWAVRAVLPDHMSEAVLQSGIERQLDTVIAQMSHWLPHSTLSQFNCAPADSWHALPDPFHDVLSCALRVAHDSNGAYDPTAGALVDVWGFGAVGRFDEPGFVVPASTQIQHALHQGGWQKLQVDHQQRRVHQRGGMRLDLSAIAKGYAVDRIAGFLTASGVTNHLVEVGGELRGAGMKPDAMPWWVALEQPLLSSTTHEQSGDTALSECIIALHEVSVATSGDYRRCFERHDGHYSHTIDPRDGQPIRHGLASVTVIHRECMMADALSTALNVLGMEQGMRFAISHDIAARFIQRTPAGFSEHFSPALLRLENDD